MAMAPATNSVAYQSARRRPKNSGLRPEDISDASHRLQQLLLERPIDLFAQPADEHVDDVGLRIEVVFPDVRQDHRLRYDLAGVANQIFEQHDLARPQIERLAAAVYLARQQIERQV